MTEQDFAILTPFQLQKVTFFDNNVTLQLEVHYLLYDYLYVHRLPRRCIRVPTEKRKEAGAAHRKISAHRMASAIPRLQACMSKKACHIQ